MSRFSDINKILDKETEEWLAYLHGQQLNNLKHLKDSNPKYSGVIVRSVAYFYHLLQLFFSSILVKKRKESEIDFYIYAGTVNQADSLISTIKSLSDKNQTILAQSTKSNLLNKPNTEACFDQLKVKFSDVLIGVGLFFYRGRSLYLRLNAKDRKLIDNYFNVFCTSYIYLAVFHRVIKKYNPSYVIVSNDHNVDCRSLLAVAHFLGVRTVYMQHASVSNLFPALTVDYAFLDGQCALDTYMECENNKSNFYQSKDRAKIFLTGQKKILVSSDKKEKNKVGLAINTLDDVSEVFSFVEQLIRDGFHVSIRWHPRQVENDVRLIKNSLADKGLVSLSDPKKQSVNDFLSEVSFIVSGNSSIHLEAAVAGVTPIYYELQPSSHSDYYNYVKNGLAIKANTYKQLKRMLLNKDKPSQHTQAVQYYSSTYASDWYGKEGELVAKTLLDMKANN